VELEVGEGLGRYLSGNYENLRGFTVNKDFPLF
jgi:hypothetical protein